MTAGDESSPVYLATIREGPMRVARLEASLVLTIETEQETERLGRALAELVRPGTVIGLIGPLGAGKTRLARALAEALGVPSRAIASPTFVLIQEYEARLPIYHFDTYRLDDAEAFDDLGAEEYFEGVGLCLIEWADRVADRLPRDAWLIRIEPWGTARTMTLEIPGPARDALAARLASPGP